MCGRVGNRECATLANELTVVDGSILRQRQSGFKKIIWVKKMKPLDLKSMSMDELLVPSRICLRGIGSQNNS
jgi:hypothetical protein